MNNILELPQLIAKFGYKIPENQIILVSGGNAPDAQWLKSISEGKDVFCADHGIDICKQANIKPVQLIGDGDSASSEAWQWAVDNNVTITKVPTKKDVTDTQLALQIIDDKYPASTVILTGAWGGRFDHAFSSIFSFNGMLKSNFYGCIADDKEILFFLHNEEHLTLNLKQHPKAISLLPLCGTSSGVSIDGVYWPLDQVMLNNNLPYAVSNEIDSKENTIWISQKQGILGVYLYFE
ncbi:thiamine diphosphokinase [uncultured Megamonas sp.]|uniref:thiamine diphosphokinase n=1 Tax=uncultured Megamonas sp. TaxID=286140 RepID=UPI0025DD9C1B|nr:thiamine diphosphokinase [uncultured Megamonas sp.]